MRALVSISTLLLALAFYACSNTEVVQVNDDLGNLSEEYVIDKATKLKQGYYKKFYESGTRQEEAYYEKDSLQGRRTLYYPSGEVHIEERYEQGLITGEYKVYFEDGQVELEGVFADNSMTGVWTRYYPNGEVMEEVTFEGNQENGPFTEYYESGKLKAEGAYLNGDFEHGLLKLYNEEGVLERKMQCQAGVCRTIWTLEEGDITPTDIEL